MLFKLIVQVFKCQCLRYGCPNETVFFLPIRLPLPTSFRLVCRVVEPGRRSLVHWILILMFQRNIISQCKLLIVSILRTEDAP